MAAMDVDSSGLPEPARIVGPPWDPRVLIDRASAHYIKINESYPGLTRVNVDPPIYTVRGFLTPAECKRLQEQGAPGLVRSVVVDAVGGISPSSTRTSSSCFLLKSETVWLAERITALTGRPAETHEPPQVARYNAGEFYKAHFDAFDLASESGRGCYLTGGQRVGTVLIYLNDVSHGGSTHFPELGLHVAPEAGMAVVFFPCTADGFLDRKALHAATEAVDEKWVSQVWLREAGYYAR